MLTFLQSAPVAKALHSLTQQSGGLLTPEIIRILSSLLWNPAVYGAMSMVFVQAPMFEEDEDELPATQTLTPLDPISFGGPHKPTKVPLRRAEVHTGQMMQILNKLSPESGGSVTLEQLRAYQPANEEEAQTLNLLKQGRVFQALAQLDGESESLSPTDVRLMISQEMIMLYDAHMMLVMLP